MALSNWVHLPPASEGWGKVIFSLGVSVHTSTGGGTPSQVWVGGTPSQVWPGEVTPSQVWLGGVPHPRSDQGGTPSQVWLGVPYPRSGGGVPHTRSGGYPISGPGGTRGTPLPRLEMGYPPT